MDISILDTDEITADNYFEYVKSKKNTATLSELESFRENALYLLGKYKTTNQIAGMKKLMFIINSIEKEELAVSEGIDQFVYKVDIEDFIKNVSSKAVKIIELENYPREIPDDIILEFEKVKDVFDRFYVVFTDYTGEVERQVEKSRQDKDPILFGAFHNREDNSLAEKFYYIGDWIDEYCDLTLEKMVTEMKSERGENIAHSLSVPETLDELRKELDSYVYKMGSYIKDDASEASTGIRKLFSIIKGWFKK